MILSCLPLCGLVITAKLLRFVLKVYTAIRIVIVDVNLMTEETKYQCHFCFAGICADSPML